MYVYCACYLNIVSVSFIIKTIGLLTNRIIIAAAGVEIK